LSESEPHVSTWIAACIPGGALSVRSARSLKRNREREVWDCTWDADGTAAEGILSIFKHGSLERVNTSLTPGPAARKCALAQSELSSLGVPTPRLLGAATLEPKAAVLCEKIRRRPWNADARVAAARILARLHCLSLASLSESLQELVRASDPRVSRTTGETAPVPPTLTLVHGDYFAANILVSEAGLRIIDWETLGLGDPMWDLAFLVGAERMEEGDGEAAIAEYARSAPVDRGRLEWHRRSWIQYWSRRML
jgi:hypothetical protein